MALALRVVRLLRRRVISGRAMATSVTVVVGLGNGIQIHEFASTAATCMCTDRDRELAVSCLEKCGKQAGVDGKFAMASWSPRLPPVVCTWFLVVVKGLAPLLGVHGRTHASPSHTSLLVGGNLCVQHCFVSKLCAALCAARCCRALSFAKLPHSTTTFSVSRWFRSSFIGVPISKCAKF